MIAACALIPAASIVLVIGNAMRTDLSDLTPIANRAGAYSLLSWPALLQDHARALHADSSIYTGAAVRVLGYMMDGDRPVRDQQRVEDFVLLPDAGTPLHPAHRFGDQMIAVHLKEAAPVQFSSGALVWVWGTMRVLPGDPGGPRPLYALEGVRVQAAYQDEIARYFR